MSTSSALALLESVCSRYGLRACGRLSEVKRHAEAVPPDILLPVLVGLLDDAAREARLRGLAGVAGLLEEARRDLEWVMREALD